MTCESKDCGVCPARARLAAFVVRFTMVEDWDPEAEENDPPTGGRFALAMYVRRADETGPLADSVFDVALYGTLNAALAGAADNVEEGWMPEQILDTETGDVYRPGVHIDVTADVDPAYRVSL